MSSIARGKGKSKVRWNVTKSDRVYIGLDVHKRTVHAAALVNDELARTWTMPYSPAGVTKALAEFEGIATKVVYEAGPTGFGLARALAAAGHRVEVVAPSKTPRRPGPESKSDRLDCRKLAVFAAKGLLRAVAIPTVQQEADRQVARLRSQCVGKVKRAKQQIKALLLQHGIEEPEGFKTWSQVFVNALRGMKLQPDIRFCLDRLIAELVYLIEERLSVEERLRVLARTRRNRAAIRVLDDHPAIGPVTATAFAFEIFSPERFDTPEQVASYVGLAPRTSQSGETRHGGKIMKTGRAALRALLVEAAWRWIGRDARAKAVYRRMLANTGRPQKAIVAVARRLAIQLWKRLIQARAQAA